MIEPADTLGGSYKAKTYVGVRGTDHHTKSKMPYVVTVALSIS
jgi:hypothetical protein